MWRKVLKWIIYGVSALLLLLVIAIACAGFLVGTPSGINFALKRANSSIPGKFSVGDVQGGLLGHLVLHDIHYSNDTLSVDIDEFRLHWVPAALLEETFHVELLKVQGVIYRQLRASEPSPEEETASGPVTLPDVKLPITIKIDDLRVNGVSLVQKGADVPVQIDSAALSALFDTSGITLSRLDFTMPGVSFGLNGRVNPVGKYPLDFKMKWAVGSGDMRPAISPPVSLGGKGALSGNLSSVTFTQDISGDVRAVLLVHARELLGALSWDADIRVHEVSEGLLSSIEAVPELKDIRPKLMLSAEGDLKQAEASLSLDVRPAQRLNVPKHAGAPSKDEKEGSGPVDGPIARPAGVMRFDVNATAHFETLEFDAQGSWHGIQWPLAGAPQYVSDNGRFSVSGTPQKYLFSLRADANGLDIPDVSVELGGSGSDHDVDLQRLHAALLDGSVDVTAKAAWKPAVKWDASLAVSDINPGRLAQEWPGKISMSLDTRGTIEGESPDLEVNLKDLSGTLREKALSGSGDIRMSGGEILIDAFNLGLGSALVDVKGKVGTKKQAPVDLSWDVSVPDAAELLPHASGSIKSSGTLSGTAALPAASGSIQVRALSVAGSTCKSLDSDFSLFLDEKKHSFLTLKASDISAGGQSIPSASLDLKGTLSDHSLGLSVDHELARVGLRLEHGALDLEKKRWKGLLSSLGIDSMDFGAWNLNAPVNLDLSPEEADVSNLCLADGNASICVLAHWIKDGEGSASAQVRGITFERFSDLLPPAVTELTGEINADLKAGLGAVPIARLNLAISPGVMEYTVDETRQVRIEYQGGTVDATVAEKDVSASIKLEMGDSGVAASVVIPRKLLEEDPKTAPLDGVINLDVKALGLITAFVPEVKDTEGSLTADFNLGGTVGDPRVNGKAMLSMAGPDVPMIGLDIDETLFDITADSRTGLVIKGTVRSAEDQLNVHGDVIIDAKRGWPSHVELTGSNFMIVNIPDAMVRISPDIKVDYSGETGVKVRGSLTIPEAEITPNEIPEGVEKPSDDVVIVSDEEPEGEKEGLPVDTDLTLRLLDKVHFKGFGLDCYLTGEVTFVALPEKQPSAHGELKIAKGTFRFYGHDLTIAKGVISYAGGRLDNPGVNLLAFRDVAGTNVGVRVTGYVTDLNITGYSSDPSISSQDALTMLITGKSKNDPGFSEAAANTAAIAGADMMAQQLKGYTGLDHLSVKGAGENSSETRVFAGKDVTEDLTVGVEAGTDDDGTQFVARYHLWKGLDFEMKSGSARSGASLLYTITFK